jgi:hypothetical protein
MSRMRTYVTKMSLFDEFVCMLGILMYMVL